jgi:hypothetical protein
MATAERRPMRETWYRASRWMRVMGNPMAYRIVKALGTQQRHVKDLKTVLGEPVSTISNTLRQLRQVDIVRYETAGSHKVYWVKDARLLALLRKTERMVDRMRWKTW